jgi:hypothetical protein
LAEADFERFFDGQQVLNWRGGIAVDFLDGYCEDGPVHTGFMVTRQAGAQTPGASGAF